MDKQTSVQENLQHEDFSDAGSNSFKSPLTTAAEILLMITSFTLIIGLLSMPIAFHFTDTTNSTNLTLLQEKLFALQQNASLNQTVVTITNSTSSCNSELLADSWVQAEADGTCLTELYSGSICTPYLQVWRSCVLDKGYESTVEIASTNSLQSDHETLLNTVNGFLESFPECQSEALPFLCQYYFPLADCEASRAYQSSKEECLRISTSVCVTLWALAMNSGFGDSLPVCENLKQANDFPSNQSTSSNTSYNTTVLECKEGFTIINATCHPKCDQFIQNSDAANIFLLTSELLAASTVILISILIGIFFIKNRIGVLSYPSFLIIFMATNMLLQAILMIISGTDRDKLFCSSPGVIGSLDNPTTFTIVSGVMYHYLLMNLILWWFVHIILFTTRLCLPIQSLNITRQGLHKYIIAFIILLCSMLPIPAIGFAVSAERHAYRLQRLPPGLPTTSNELWFYSVIFLYCVLLAAGLCMLIVSLWTLLKRALRKKTFKGRTAKENWSLILYFTLSAVYFIVFITYSSVWTVNYNNLTRTLTEYFLCEALGPSANSCSRDEFEKYSYPFLEGFAALCRVFVQLGILIVAVNSQGLDTKHCNPSCNPSPTNEIKEKNKKLSVINPAYF